MNININIKFNFFKPKKKKYNDIQPSAPPYGYQQSITPLPKYDDFQSNKRIHVKIKLIAWDVVIIAKR